MSSSNSSAVLVPNTKEKDNSENLIPDNPVNTPLQNTDKLSCQTDCRPVVHTVPDRQALASLQLNSEKHGNECLNSSGPVKVAPEHKEPTATIVNQITRETVTSDRNSQKEPQDKSSGSEDPSLVLTQELSSEGTWESCADRLASLPQPPSIQEPTTPQHSGSDKFDTAEDLSSCSYSFDDLPSSKEVSFTLPVGLSEIKCATNRSEPTSPPKTYSVQSLTHLITTVLENNPEICSQKLPEATCDLPTQTQPEVVVSEHDSSSPEVPKKALVHPSILQVQSSACNLSESFCDQFSNLKIHDITASDIKSETESNCDLVEICSDYSDCNAGVEDTTASDLKSETESNCDLVEICPGPSDCHVDGIDSFVRDYNFKSEPEFSADLANQEVCIANSDPLTSFLPTDKSHLEYSAHVQAAAAASLDHSYVVADGLPQDPPQTTVLDLEVELQTSASPLCDLQNDKIISGSSSEPDASEHFTKSLSSLADVSNSVRVKDALATLEATIPSSHPCAIEEYFDNLCISEQNINQVSSCAEASDKDRNLSLTANKSFDFCQSLVELKESFAVDSKQVAESSEKPVSKIESVENQPDFGVESKESVAVDSKPVTESSEKPVTQIESVENLPDFGVELKESVTVDSKPVTESFEKPVSQIESVENLPDFGVELKESVAVDSKQLTESSEKSVSQIKSVENLLDFAVELKESVAVDSKPVTEFSEKPVSQIESVENPPDFRVESSVVPTALLPDCLQKSSESATCDQPCSDVVSGEDDLNSNQTCTESVPGSVTPSVDLLLGLDFQPDTETFEPIEPEKSRDSTVRVTETNPTCLETVEQVPAEETPIFHESNVNQSAPQYSTCLETVDRLTRDASTEAELQERNASDVRVKAEEALTEVSEANQSATQDSGVVLTPVYPAENTSEEPIAKEIVFGNFQSVEPKSETLTKDFPTLRTEDYSPVDILADFPVIDTTELEQLIQVPHNLNLSFEAMPVQMMEPQMDHQWHADDQMNTIPLGSDNNCAVDINVNPCRLIQGNNYHDNEETLKTAHVNSTTVVDCGVMSSPNKRKNEEDSAFEDLANVEDSNSDLVDDHIMDDNADEIGVAAVSRRSPSQTRIPEPKVKLPLPTNNSEGHTAPTDQPAVNHSEAGPEVAEFTEEEFRTAAEVFKDPSTFEFLERVSNTKAFEESSLSRLSLYVKFDPLVSKRSQEIRRQSTFKKPVAPQKKGVPVDQDPATGGDQLISISDYPASPPVIKRELDANKLIDFHSPNPPSSVAKGSPKMVPVEPVQRIENMQSCKLFTEDDMKKAIQINDLLFQERLIKKEKEIVETERKNQSQVDEIQNQVSILQESLTFTRSMLEESAQMMRRWQEKKELERVETTRERDQALEDMRNVEASFSELHRRYEKIKAVLQGYKQNEEGLRVQLLDTQEKLRSQEQMYEALKQLTQEKLESANLEIESAKKAGGSEIAVLRSQLMKAEMKISSLEKSLENKAQEFAQLTDIYDDLVARVSGGQ